MHIVEELRAAEQYKGVVGLTIGNFEGLHRGHLVIIRTLVAACRHRGLVPSVMTFKQHPLGVIGKPEPERLVAPMDKIDRLAAEGIDLLLYLDFTPSFASVEPRDFLCLLKGHLDPRLYCLGGTFRFGRGNQGSLDLLRSCREELGYELLAVEEVPYDGGAISSTRIRREVKAGRFERMRGLLDNCYYTYLVPVEGNRVRLFMQNWALPGRGSYSGDLEDLETGGRLQAVLRIGEQVAEAPAPAERALFLEIEGEEQEPHPDTLYRFYFVKPCRGEK